MWYFLPTWVQQKFILKDFRGLNESTGWYSCQKATAVIPTPHLEHGRTRTSWIWTKLDSMPKGASTIGKWLEGCSEEALRNWDKRNLRSTNKLRSEWLICETMISFILSFPGKQNEDQWGEVTWRFISAQYKEFADNAAIRWQYTCPSVEQVVLWRRTTSFCPPLCYKTRGHNSVEEKDVLFTVIVASYYCRWEA